MEEKILVVSDTSSLRRIYENKLSEHGFAIDISLDGKDALHKLQEELIDLVLLDLDIEHGSGLSYLQEFVACRKKAKVVVVSDSSVYKNDFHSWAADAYLLKSTDLEELKNTIDAILHED